MAVDPRQVVAGFLTISMFLMLGNMIKHDHFSSSQVSEEATGIEFNAIKLGEHTTAAAAAATDVNRFGIELLKEANEEIKPCWTRSGPKDHRHSNGFVTFSLTIGPEYHISQIADAVVIAWYLGATLVLPDIRGKELGHSRNFEDMYDVEKFMRSLNGVVEIARGLPPEVRNRRPAVIRVPNRVTEDFIKESIQPTFRTNNYLRLAVAFSSVSLKPRETKNKELDSTACLAMFGSLELKPEILEVAREMVEKLKELAKKSEGLLVAIDLRTDMLDRKSCKRTGGARRKGCFNPSEVADFLSKVGFSADTTVYLTETWWHRGLDPLREVFPRTYTKDDIMPAETKHEFLQTGNAELARALDLHICSQSDVFVPAISGLFYGHVAGKRIAAGKTQILVPSQVFSASAQASDFVSTYVSKKNHLAYSCYC